MRRPPADAGCRPASLPLDALGELDGAAWFGAGLEAHGPIVMRGISHSSRVLGRRGASPSPDSMRGAPDAINTRGGWQCASPRSTSAAWRRLPTASHWLAILWAPCIVMLLQLHDVTGAARWGICRHVGYFADLQNGALVRLHQRIRCRLRTGTPPRQNYPRQIPGPQRREGAHSIILRHCGGGFAVKTAGGTRSIPWSCAACSRAPRTGTPCGCPSGSSGSTGLCGRRASLPSTRAQRSESADDSRTSATPDKVVPTSVGSCSTS